MAIRVQCATCGASYTLNDALAGKKVKCGKCRQSMVLPGAAAVAVPMGRFVPPPPPPGAGVADDSTSAVVLPDFASAEMAIPPLAQGARGKSASGGPPPAPGQAAAAQVGQPAAPRRGKQAPAGGVPPKLAGDSRAAAPAALPIGDTSMSPGESGGFKRRKKNRTRTPSWVIGTAVLLPALLIAGICYVVFFRAKSVEIPIAKVEVPKDKKLETADAKSAKAPAEVAAPKEVKVEAVADVPETAGSAKSNWVKISDSPSTRFGLAPDALPKVTPSLPAVNSAIFSTAPSPFLAFTGTDATELWDFSEAKKVGTVKLPANSSQRAVINSTGKYLLAIDSAAATPQPAIWSFQSGELVQHFPEALYKDFFDFTGPEQIITIEGAQVQLWDVNSGRQTAEFKLPLTPAPESLVLSPGRKWLAYIAVDPAAKNSGLALQVVEIAKGELTDEYHFPTAEKWTMKPLALSFSPSGTDLAAWLQVDAKGVTLPYKTRLMNWSLATGSVWQDYKIADELYPIKSLGKADRRLDWTENRDGWLLDHTWLVYRQSGKVRWETPLPAGFVGLLGMRVVDDKRLVAVWAKQHLEKGAAKNEFALETVTLPDRSTLPESIAVEKPKDASGEPTVLAANVPPGKPNGKPSQTNDGGKKPPEPIVSAEPADQPPPEPKFDEKKMDLAMAELNNYACHQKEDDTPNIYPREAGFPVISLDFRLTEFGDAGLEKIQGLIYLQELNLNGTAVTDKGGPKLAAFTRLKSLDLSGTSIGNPTLEGIRWLTNLQSLDLHGTAVGDDGVKSLLKMHKLKSLDLSDTFVTNKGVALLKQLPTLGEVKLRNLKLVTRPVVDDLKQAVPGLSIDQ